jgi:hypothetical protein
MKNFDFSTVVFEGSVVRISFEYLSFRQGLRAEAEHCQKGNADTMQINVDSKEG